MGAAAERMQLRCAVRPSPLASQKSSSNCERALAARLGATPGTGGSNRAWGAQRERVERTLLSTTTAASSLESRAAIRNPGFETKNPGTVKIWLGDGAPFLSPPPPLAPGFAPCTTPPAGSAISSSSGAHQWPPPPHAPPSPPRHSLVHPFIGASLAESIWSNDRETAVPCGGHCGQLHSRPITGHGVNLAPRLGRQEEFPPQPPQP